MVMKLQLHFEQFSFRYSKAICYISQFCQFLQFTRHLISHFVSYSSVAVGVLLVAQYSYNSAEPLTCSTSACSSSCMHQRSAHPLKITKLSSRRTTHSTFRYVAQSVNDFLLRQLMSLTSMKTNLSSRTAGCLIAGHQTAESERVKSRTVFNRLHFQKLHSYDTFSLSFEKVGQVC